MYFYVCAVACIRDVCVCVCVCVCVFMFLLVYVMYVYMCALTCIRDVYMHRYIHIHVYAVTCMCTHMRDMYTQLTSVHVQSTCVFRL
jgi:hypothetical protein